MREMISTAADVAKMWISCAELATNASNVVVYRMMGMGGAWSVPSGENQRMMDEKAPAFTEAMVAGSMCALAGKRPDQVMQAAIKPLSKKARSNRKRLERRGPKVFGVSVR